MFRKHNKRIRNDFDEIVKQGHSETEGEFLDSLNLIFREVAEDKDKLYRPKDKLQIYERLQQISNCDPSDRSKYAKKVRKAL